MHYTKAKQIADRIYEVLRPYCHKIDIAGSIRREQPEVKDIEIVCLPHKQDSGTSLFGEAFFVSRNFKGAAAVFIDEVVKGNFEGRYMQVKLKNTDILLDLFMPQQYDYYRQLAIRTGSKDYARDVIATGWLKKGWCGVSKIGLRKIVDCEDIAPPCEKSDWRLIKSDTELPPSWTSEEEFFSWLDVPYIEPKNR